MSDSVLKYASEKTLSWMFYKNIVEVLKRLYLVYPELLRYEFLLYPLVY